MYSFVDYHVISEDKKVIGRVVEVEGTRFTEKLKCKSKRDDPINYHHFTIFNLHLIKVALSR